MIPNIDPTTPSASLPNNAQVRRNDASKAIAEAYNVPVSDRKVKQAAADSEDKYPGAIPDEAVDMGADSSAAGKIGTTDYQKGVYGRQSKTRVLTKDEAEINFQLTREERDVFINAMSGNEPVKDMSEEEQQMLQKTAERIEKILEAVDTRTTEGRQRADAAIKEWYSRLANGKYKAPSDLVRLIQAAALGVDDLTKIQ